MANHEDHGVIKMNRNASDWSAEKLDRLRRGLPNLHSQLALDMYAKRDTSGGRYDAVVVL